MTNNHSFFQNRDCKYFPCHKDIKEAEFNCLFCYCPLYTLGDKCGGNFKINENNIKDCTNCTFPHHAENYKSVVGNFNKISEMEKKQRDEGKIILLRHGLTSGNEKGAYIGRTDEELSKNGENELIKKYSNNQIKADIVFSSPMKRCIQSAGIVAEASILCQKEWLKADKAGIKMIVENISDNKILDNGLITIDNFREIDFGNFEGKTYKELNGNEDYQAYIDSGGMSAFPGGEEPQEFIDRCMKGFYEAMKIAKKTEAKNILMVVHGGTIKAIVSSLTGCGFHDVSVKNGEMVVIQNSIC